MISRIAFLVLGAAALLACRDSSAPASLLRYDLVLHQDSIREYGCNLTPSECQKCSLYCMYWVAQPSTATISFLLDSAKGTALYRSKEYAITYSPSGDATIKLEVNVYCDDYYLTGTLTSSGFQGTWSEQLDCHGRSRTGTFTGVRAAGGSGH